MSLPLPEDTNKHVFKNNRLRTFSNFGLLFNKYVDWNIKDENGKKIWEKKKNIADEILKSFVDRNNSKNLESLSEILEFLKVRQIRIINSYKSQGFKTKSFPMKTDYRLIIGLGGAHVLETGLTLHPLYGFPYIPASSVKGIARAYAEISKEASEDELREMFGSEDKNKVLETNREGKVVFFDGFPTEFPKLEVDIMNPHYGDYYQGKRDGRGNPIPPADYLSPNPITFLTVAPGQEFSFLLFSKDVSLVEKAEQWLIGGLTDLGAGGKTNVGYGYFKIVEQQQVVEDKMIKEQPAKTGNLQIADLLTTKLKSVKNPETFSSFVKQLKTENIQELQQISFNDMKSVINIGLVPTLESLEIPQEIKQIIAKKMLEVCSKPDEKHKEKLEKYKRLLIIARSDT